jgi:lactate dehydrogenase-like 2-hydroxyacid dehydrogenase
LRDGPAGAGRFHILSAQVNLLIGAPSRIITLHIAWTLKESRAEFMDIAARNLEVFLNGRSQSIVYENL